MEVILTILGILSIVALGFIFNAFYHRNENEKFVVDVGRCLRELGFEITEFGMGNILWGRFRDITPYETAILMALHAIAIEKKFFIENKEKILSMPFRSFFNSEVAEIRDVAKKIFFSPVDGDYFILHRIGYMEMRHLMYIEDSLNMWAQYGFVKVGYKEFWIKYFIICLLDISNLNEEEEREQYLRVKDTLSLLSKRLSYSKKMAKNTFIACLDDWEDIINGKSKIFQPR